MAEWFGRLSGEGVGREASDSRELPEAIRNWHSIVGQYTASFRSTKKLLIPLRKEASGKKRVFLEEWTGEWEWAVEAGDEYTVYDREAYGEWRNAAESLPEFIKHNAIHEVICGAGRHPRYQCRDVDGQFLDSIVDSMEEVGFKGWRWPVEGGRIYVGNGLAAQVLPVPESGRSHVMVVSTSPGFLGYLDEMPLKWIKINSKML